MIKDFNTLNEFFNTEDKEVTTNDFVRTYGFGEVNDGGSGLYKVKSLSASEPGANIFNGFDVTCGGCTLELIPENGTVRVEQFGIAANCDFENMTAKEKTELLFKNKNAIQAAVDSGASRVEFSPGTYYVAEDILIDHPVDIVGNGAKLVLETDSTSTQLFRVEYAVDAAISNASISDMTIEGTHTITQEQVADPETNETETVDKITNYNHCINLNNVTDYTISGVNFEYGNYAIYVSDSKNIIVENCVCDDVTKALYFSNTSTIKMKNVKAKMVSVGSQGLIIMGNTNNVIVEDVSITNAIIALFVHDISWSDEKKATDRILFKNLLVDKADTVAWFRNTYIPVCFSNAMFVDIKKACFILTKAENISVNNSSVLLAAPADCAANAAPIYISGATKIKFTHAQFEFPCNLQLTLYDHFHWGDIDVGFVDCTIQKTDIACVEGVEDPIGFGVIGYAASVTDSFTETFDACEFRSYIQNYSADNMPVVLSAPNNSDSKLIIKNCRFVNDSTCTVPYFKLDDSAKFDNIVVYNCFFENYEFSKGEGEDKHYPIFGRVVDGAINTDNTDSGGEKIHNIFARCNMRSSAPDRTNGTTINEMLEYI